VIGPLPSITCWKAVRAAFSSHAPPFVFGWMSRTVTVYLPWPVIPLYAPVPSVMV